MEIRQSIRIFPAFDLSYETRRIPLDAVLEDFRIEKGHEGIRQRTEGWHRFIMTGQVYYNAASHIVGCTKVIGEST